MQFFLIVDLALRIHEHNVIDGIVRRSCTKRFQFQFYKKHYKVCYWVAMKGEVGGGSQGSEVYSCLVGWWYLWYACSAFDTNIGFLHGFMLPPNNISKSLFSRKVKF